MAGGSGVATGAGTRVDVTLKLSQLQNLCKRDPDGYRDDYNAQTRRLESECGILALSPSSDPSPRLVELIQFAAAVSSSSYKGKESDRIAALLIDLLLGSSSTSSNSNAAAQTKKGAPLTMTIPTSAMQLHRNVRKACVSALILMRNKGAVEPLRLMELFFRILAVVPDKTLRELLHRHIVNDIRNINKKGKRNEKVNKSVQAFLHRVVSLSMDESSDDEGHVVAAKRATDMCCELYRRGVWTDERTVAILASAATSRNTTVMARALRFFLNIEEKMALDKKRDQDDEWHGVDSIDYHKFSRKTKRRERQVAKQVRNKIKAQRKREEADQWETMDDEGVEHSKKLYPAIEMLHDPQGLAETVFKRLRSSGSIRYDVKLLMMNFVTRLVGNHELLLLPLYPFLQKYMGGHQRDVTQVLAYAVQSCHEYVPPDEVYGVLKTIAHNFITERCSGEQMAVGINAARAICARVPAAMSIEESQESSGSTVMDIEAFARDLAAYSNHRDRSVSIAGKGWTNFVREVHPSLLQGKDRGMKGSALHRAGEKPLRYGEQKVAAGVAGADLLVEYEAKKAAARKKQTGENEDLFENNDEGDGIEEVPMNDEGESDDGWVDVEEDEEQAPQLMRLDGDEADAATDNDDSVLDVSKMSAEERDKLKQEISSTRIFSAGDFVKMRKLVDREQRAKRDPREAARRKRAIARGNEFEELSDDESIDLDDEDRLRISGVVNPSDIMAEAKKKRMNKVERLESILSGREKFESKARDGGSTNTEKLRKKNFKMTKYSTGARIKRNGKNHSTRKRMKQQGTLDPKKRRRKG